MTIDGPVAASPAQQRRDRAVLAQRVALVAHDHDLDRVLRGQRDEVLNGVGRGGPASSQRIA
jgi:hypothetical protein